MIIALQTLIFFRQSFLNALDRLLRPYYMKLALTFSRKVHDGEDEDTEEQVFADFDDERGVIFFPPMYAQRYAAVSDCLMDERWCGKLEKVVDLGYHDMSFIKYLKEIPGIRHIMGVDIESISLRCSSDLLGYDEYSQKRETPLQISLFQGNAADPDYRLIGCDAVIAIEMIEHMLPHDLDRLVHTVFGFIKPWIAVLTTPNADFNVLFKNMEKNGLRRFDHFFEWTREQFNDWCSNIVVRYPQYTVVCKGVGPGPPGTGHHGSCSQLALFINKDYQKQQDLDPNSLMLVAGVPSPNAMSDMVAGWESPEVFENNMICPPNVPSFSDVLYPDYHQSAMTIVLASPSFSIEDLEYSDKTSQCNLDTETGRNFLMFDYEEMCFTVIVPRRKVDHKIYDIEDVTCRLNCTTNQVKKFSKTTQNLMAKNKIDSIVHTREVVDEIRNLTNMLNFSRGDMGNQDKSMWYNINWGENAPYWNQYYKIVREYNYPFETKSEDARILDLISEEINRLVDFQYGEEFATDVNKLEIPLERLMNVVKHITTDIDVVRDLLEWNGYEIVNNVLIHTRFVLENTSVISQDEEWPENDTISDWDTADVTSLSDGSTMVPHNHGRAIRHALDKKVRNLRNMLSADEDITTELDRVVCRLMKLALKTSKHRQTPVPSRWMQCKLLDLLTLTEKAISRRKRHFIDSFPLQAICYDHGLVLPIMGDMRDDSNVEHLVNKYHNLISAVAEGPDNLVECYSDSRSMFGDDLCDFTCNKHITEFNISGKVQTEDVLSSNINKYTAEIKLERTQAWLEDDILVKGVTPYTEQDGKTRPGAIDRNIKIKKTTKKAINKSKLSQLKAVDSKESEKKYVKAKRDMKTKEKTSRAKLRNIIRNKSSSSSFIRNYKKLANYEYGKNITKPKWYIKEHKKLQSTASKPIPGSIIELCNPDYNNRKSEKTYEYFNRNEKKDSENRSFDSNVAATEESLLVDIVMDGGAETIALRRTIGTDPEDSAEQEIIIRSISNVPLSNSFINCQVSIDDMFTDAIFLNDINEPSTSKGIRHVNTDAQCGPDTVVPMPSPATSLTMIPDMFRAGINIGDSLTNLATKIRISEAGTSTIGNTEIYSPVCARAMTPPFFEKGIKIEDSIENMAKRVDRNNTKKNCAGIRSSSFYRKSLKTYEPEMNKTKCTDFGTLTDICWRSDSTKTVKVGDSIVDLATTCCEYCGFSADSQEDCHSFLKNNSINVFKEKNVEDPRTNANTKTHSNFISCADKNNLNSSKTKRGRAITPIKFRSIKISDSLTDISSKKSSISSTSNDAKRRTTFSPTVKSFEIKMSDRNIVENVLDSNYKKPYLLPLKFDSVTDTNIKGQTKHVKSLRSGSKCDSYKSAPSSPVRYRLSASTSSYIDDEDTYLKQSMSKLGRGGVHIHSFKEKNYSEDVVYQGEWQTRKLNLSPKKRCTLMAKNSLEPKTAPCKENLQLKNNKEKKFEHKKPDGKIDAKKITPPTPKVKKITPPTPKVNPKDYIRERAKKSEQVKKVSSSNRIGLAKNVRQIKNITKVASKITIKSSISSKNIKVTRVAKRPNAKNEKTAKKDVPLQDKNSTLKSYIPLYLLRKRAADGTLNSSIDKVTNEDSPRKEQSLIKAEMEEIKINLLKIPNEPFENLTYAVYRNEVENLHKSNVDSESPDNSARIIAKKRNVISKRPSSNGSQNSSTCSTPDSVATVKAAPNRSKIFTKKHSTASTKSSAMNSESDSNTSSRNKPKLAKRAKTSRKAEDDKENIPESSKAKAVSKESLKMVKSSFMGKSKSVFMAQFSSDNAPVADCLSKHKSNKSNVKIPSIEIKDEKMKSNIELKEKNESVKSKNFGYECDAESGHNENSNNNVVLHTLPYDIMQEDMSHHDSHSENFQEDNTSPIIGILSEVRQMVDEKIALLGKTPYKDDDERFEKSSIASFKTLTSNSENENFYEFTSDIEALNISFDLEDDTLSLNDVEPKTAELDLLSYKSTLSASEFPDTYFTYQDMMDQVRSVSSNSVQDIFERKDTNMIQPTSAGMLAIQAFSGFSMNAEPIVGDQPDYINLIDSETGSLALDMARQITSEELFVSGRSSGSYESCIIEEDSVVPNWLFQLISQQQASLEDDQPVTLPIALPLDEPAYDVNGNVLDTNVGAGAGAGDGRGMHSDHSQDSSGRGTSLSSSETSSGQISEAILIEPSTFTPQFELAHDTIGSSIGITTLVVPIESPELHMAVEDAPTESPALGSSRSRRYHSLATSDVDADVSSLDTDVPDSSDY